jgi:hypothetical protein
MNHTNPTSPPAQATPGEMFWELMDLTAGVGVALVPVLLLAVPGIVLVVVPTMILLLAVTLPLALIAAPPYLLARWLRRRRRIGPRRPLVIRSPRTLPPAGRARA